MVSHNAHYVKLGVNWWKIQVLKFRVKDFMLNDLVITKRYEPNLDTA